MTKTPEEYYDKDRTAGCGTMMAFLLIIILMIILFFTSCAQKSEYEKSIEKRDSLFNSVDSVNKIIDSIDLNVEQI